MNYKIHIPLNEDIMLPERFIKEYEKGSKNIEKSVIIPPKLGKPGFGEIFVSFGPAKTSGRNRRRKHNNQKQ